MNIYRSAPGRGDAARKSGEPLFPVGADISRAGTDNTRSSLKILRVSECLWTGRAKIRTCSPRVGRLFSGSRLTTCFRGKKTRGLSPVTKNCSCCVYRNERHGRGEEGWTAGGNSVQYNYRHLAHKVLHRIHYEGLRLRMHHPRRSPSRSPVSKY